VRLSYLRMSESQLTDLIIEAAQLYGYRVSHFRPAKTAKGWRTPLQGDAGLPDLVLAGHGILLLVELKVGKNTLRPDQEAWRSAIPPENYRLWTDRNYRGALSELAHRSRRPSASPDPEPRSQPE
jgi:hypothetical protein